MPSTTGGVAPSSESNDMSSSPSHSSFTTEKTEGGQNRNVWVAVRKTKQNKKKFMCKSAYKTDESESNRIRGATIKNKPKTDLFSNESTGILIIN